jgi:hypothetical protein
MMNVLYQIQRFDFESQSGTRIKAVLSDDEGMGQKAYRNPACIMPGCTGRVTRNCALFRTEFTACVLCSFAI